MNPDLTEVRARTDEQLLEESLQEIDRLRKENAELKCENLALLKEQEKLLLQLLTLTTERLSEKEQKEFYNDACKRARGMLRLVLKGEEI
jgi:hypothetical protein